MSLRLRLFLLVAGLLSLLLVAQALLVRSLAASLTENVRAVALRVGNEILSGFEFRSGDAEVDGPGGMPHAGREARVLVLTGRQPEGIEGETPDAPGATEAHPGPPENGTFHWVVRQETAWGHGGPPDEPAGRPAERTEVERHALPRTSGDSPGSRTVTTERSTDGSITREVHRIVVDSPPETGMLRVRGPQLERAIPIPHAEVGATLERFGSRLLLGSLTILALGLLATVWVTRRLTRPLDELAAAARRVGEGELGVVVTSARRDEVGQAIASFNRMSARLAELDRENRRLQARRQLAELGDVARGLAHSLRNPLNALGLSLEELGARAAPETDPAPLVETARRQIRRIDGALRSFLALASRGGAGVEAVDLPALAWEVALEALQDARGRVRVTVEVAEPVPPLAAVAAELRAVLQALVVNAVEASPDGAMVAVRVAVAGPGRARVEVVDDGGGVPEAIRPRLFTPHLTTKPHGSGMGLYLAHRLATGRYGGSLELLPREGGGTLSRLELAGREEGGDG